MQGFICPETCSEAKVDDGNKPITSSFHITDEATVVPCSDNRMSELNLECQEV